MSFKPSDIAGLSLWLDASDKTNLFQNAGGTTAVTTDGQQILYLKDKSSSNNNGSTSDTGILWKQNAFGSNKPGIYFPGTQSMGFTMNLNLGSGGVSDATYFFIVNNTNTAGNIYVYFAHKGTSFIKQFWYNSNVLQIDVGGIGGLSGSTNVNNQPLIIAVSTQVSNNELIVNVNGSLLGQKTMTSSPYSSSYTLASLGTDYGSFPFTGFIGEVLTFKSILTQSQRQQVEGYLAWKWNLQTTLSASHPYKYISPSNNNTAYGIPSVGCWFDTTDISNITLLSGNITWKDKLGLGYTATNIGTVTNGTYNGLNIVDMGSSRLQIPNVDWRNKSTIIVVAKVTTPHFLLSQWNGSYTNYIYTNNWSLAKIGAFDVIDSIVPSNNAMVTTNEWFIFTVSYNLGTTLSDYRINGLRRTSATGTAIGDGVVNAQIFINGNGNSSFGSSQIAEVLLFNDCLTSAQINTVEGNLAWKWGLQGNLPTSHPYKYISPSGQTFSPTLIPNCQLWLDAADSSTVKLSTGTNVLQWNDKSGSGRNATLGAGVPTYSNNGIVFDGNQIFNTSLSSVMNTQTIFVVATCNTIAKVDLVGLSFVSGTPGIQLIIQNNQQVTTYWGGTSITNGATVAQGTRFLHGFTFNSGSTSYLYFNGTQSGSAASSPLSGTGTVSIGGYIGSGVYGEKFVGTINEVIIFSSVLKTSQRQMVEGYLSWKWGLAPNLPTSHPYKFNIPSNYLNSLLINSTLWLDAADSSSVSQNSNGSAVTNWYSKTINGNYAAKYLTNAVPLYSTASLNTLGGLTFNGTTQYLALNTPIQPNSGLSIFAVGLNNSNSNFITGSSATGSHGPYYVAFKNNLNFCINNTADNIYISNNTSTSLSTSYVLSGIFDGSTVQSYINGGVYSNSAAFSGTAKTALTTFLGGNWYGGSIGGYFSGTLNEIIVLNSVPTIDQRQLIEGYLAWKWNLQGNLSSTHPYKNSMPGNYVATNAVTNYTTDKTAVSNYVLTTSEIPPVSFLNLKSNVKTSGYVDASKNDIRTQYINNLIIKNGSNIIDINNSSDLFALSNSVQSGLSNKNVKVLLPSISGTTGSLSFPATDISNYYHLEMPTNTNVTLSGVTPTVTLSYNGTNVIYNGQTKVIGDTITINSNTYKIVALGSITLDQQSAGVGGDPHIYPIIGKPYDLPQEKGKFLLFNNVKEDNLKITCDCDFLSKQEIADSVFKSSSVTNGTFMTNLLIEHNGNELEINMKDLTINKNMCNFDITPIYEDKYIFKKFYSGMTIYKHNIHFNGKSRNIKINTSEGEYNIKLSLDLNCADHRNHVQVFGPNLKSYKGALICKDNY